MGKLDGYQIISTYSFKVVEKPVDKLSHDEMRIKDDALYVGCGRCKEILKIIRFRIHRDNYPSFHFLCPNCNWSYSCYRGSMGEFKQVEWALLH